MNSHSSSKFPCDDCTEYFGKSLDLEMHKIEKHERKKNLDEWNCNDCSYQTDTAPALLNHLKLMGHQPSPNIKDKRLVFNDYRECYTCRLGFDGYWNLMTHRKNIHPSNKKCRNFPSGKCTWGVDCWYVHEEELMEVDETFEADSVPKEPIYKCYICTIDFKSKDAFMKHRKENHTSGVQRCSDDCSRSSHS